ncbi:MAG TPA: twin-arginine translocase TatA/TatE family subunit, partial [Bacteroidales bacterium]|nr:twin-arginine translocase TatA/TatE family subunit [Bacteroidales bacterium]
MENLFVLAFIGIQEILIILLLALLFFGGRKIPEL